MKLSRRTFLTSMGALPMVAACGVDASAKAEVKPRHVLCFLGGVGGKARLSEAVSAAIGEYARGFAIDETYSRAEADLRMERSFGAGAALQRDDDLALCRVCRLAFGKRPLASEKYLESVGFHLAGLPEVYVAKAYGSEREAVAVMDTVADDIAQRKLEIVLRERKLKLSRASSYKADDFKYNPYGIVLVDRR